MSFRKRLTNSFRTCELPIYSLSWEIREPFPPHSQACQPCHSLLIYIVTKLFGIRDNKINYWTRYTQNSGAIVRIGSESVRSRQVTSDRLKNSRRNLSCHITSYILLGDIQVMQRECYRTFLEVKLPVTFPKTCYEIVDMKIYLLLIFRVVKKSG